MIHQIQEGQTASIIGVMLESNLFGRQPVQRAAWCEMRHGVSITDACIDWETTGCCWPAATASWRRHFWPEPRHKPWYLVITD